jgi:hypothetical protein
MLILNVWVLEVVVVDRKALMVMMVVVVVVTEGIQPILKGLQLEILRRQELLLMEMMGVIPQELHMVKRLVVVAVVLVRRGLLTQMLEVLVDK